MDNKASSILTSYFARVRRGKGWEKWAIEISAMTGKPITAYALKKMVAGVLYPEDYETLETYFRAKGEQSIAGHMASMKQLETIYA